MLEKRQIRQLCDEKEGYKCLKLTGHFHAIVVPQHQGTFDPTRWLNVQNMSETTNFWYLFPRDSSLYKKLC